MFTFRILELTIDILLKFPTLLYFGRNFFSLHFFTDPILLNLISFPEVSPLGSALSRKGAAVLKSTILWISLSHILQTPSCFSSASICTDTVVCCHLLLLHGLCTYLAPVVVAYIVSGFWGFLFSCSVCFYVEL